SGSLYVPLGRGKHPAVVLVHGSGPQTRWGTTRFIGDRLARHGFACLIYDKRGSGASGGDWRTVGYEALADDAIAGMRLLAARPDIDAARIGVWGHSQGGFIAPLIATRYPQTAFIVAADSTAGTNEQQDILRVQNLIGDQDWSDADKRAAMALYRRFLAVAASGQGYAELESEIRSSGNAPWVRWLGIPPADSWLWTWYPLVAHYDSRTYWRTVRVPVLLLYGERDELSDIDPSIRAISVLVRANGGPEVQAIILPDAPHELHIAPKAGEAFFWWHIVAGYPSLGIDWLAETAR
ncbi:MAG TPA: alpha/beta fold hydrolase, partial [Candidatus Baltobacteraceae bacterium]|nr:alpha/beta fold hydrolase [Candidatus Baltobacteraceae bacterium]